MNQFRLEQSPIVYYVSGKEKDEWVLFLHAAFVNHDMFRSQIDYFREKYNILTLDIIGHGKSTKTRSGDGIDQMSKWIGEILKTENIQKIHAVGVSLGAVLAQDFAARYPESVRSLACFGGYDIDNFDAKMQRENSAAQISMILKAIFSIKRFAKSNMKISAYTSRAQQEFYEMNLQFPKKSLRYLSSLGRMGKDRPPARRAYPLLIGCGAHDIPTELSAIEMWKRNEPDCSAVIFEDAGHCVNMDDPQKFNATMEEFWRNGNCKS